MPKPQRDQTEAIEVMEPAVLSQLQSAEIIAQFEIAKQNPRVISDFKDEVLTLATVDEETAASCRYAIPRAGKTIEGDSIRLAEIALHSWSNARAEGRVIEVGTDRIRAQGSFLDLEKNVGVRREITRRIVDSRGHRYNDDMIQVTSDAAVSIALRDAILSGIPKGLLKPISDKIKQIAMGDINTLPQRRTNAFEYFNRFGITEKQVLDMLGRKKMKDVNLEDVLKLRSVKNAIKDGEVSIDEVFGATPKEKQLKSKEDQTAFDEAAEPSEKEPPAAAPASEQSSDPELW